MARPKKGIIYNLETVLARLLETNAALNKRLAQLESVLIGGAATGKRGRKPGRKPGRPRKTKRGRKPSGKVCSVPACGRPYYAKGLCANHYQQKRLKEKAKVAPAKK